MSLTSKVSSILRRVLTRLGLERPIRAVLTHPLALRIKASCRTASWSLKVADVVNPPMPERVGSMLFICLGNICRSPFGALLAERLLAEAGRSDIRCSSAGIRPSQANRSPEEACVTAARYGLSLEKHRPQALTTELMDAHDVVFTVELRHFEHLRETFPQHRDRIFLLPLFDEDAGNTYERLHIADPFGHPLTAYEECYRRMERTLRRCLASIPAR